MVIEREVPGHRVFLFLGHFRHDLGQGILRFGSVVMIKITETGALEIVEIFGIIESIEGFRGFGKVRKSENF